MQMTCAPQKVDPALIAPFRSPKTIVKPTAFGPVANTDTKLLIYGLFQRGLYP